MNYYFQLELGIMIIKWEIQQKLKYSLKLIKNNYKNYANIYYENQGLIRSESVQTPNELHLNGPKYEYKLGSSRKSEPELELK